ncbi:MAG: hypothetical protein OEZ34_06640 [Spirochaetia bacterium]|nr:hypothetical protein [Spirochaetia bacterium]
MMIGKITSAEDLQDVGLYLQGLLLIMAVDDHIHERQKSRIHQFAMDIGFDKKYIDNTIQTILENKHIARIPGKFHSKSTAISFLLEAAEIAVCDGDLHPNEKKWLLDAAKINDINPEVIMEIIDSVPLIELE